MGTFLTRATAWVIGVAVLLGIAHARVDAEELQTATPSMERARAFAGGSPERCVFSAPGRQLCSWPMEGRLLSLDIADDAPLRLALICELSIDATPETPACEVHATGAPSDGLPHVSSGGDFGAGELVLERIRGAATTAALTHALGRMPAGCRSGFAVQRCDWPLPLGAREHATGLLRCELPLDGSARAPDSCALLDVEPS